MDKGKNKVPNTTSDPRMEKLRALAAGKQSVDVADALREIWTAGRQPVRVRFRRPFARHDAPLKGAFSDRRLPPRPLRPPSTRLVLPRGVAQELYLTVVFVTQAEKAPGQKASSKRLLVDPLGRSGVRPWLDLVMVPAEKRVGTSSSHLVETNRVRQLQAAVERLADDDTRLVGLPHPDAARGRLNEFVPLLDSGLRYASRSVYSVPTADEQTFSVPANFFINGWHCALTPSEVAMLFAVWAASPQDTAGSVAVWLEGDTRIRRYGLSPDAYGTQNFLASLGVLEVTVPPGRRPDGTFVGHKKGDPPLLNSLRVVESGFDKPAVATVMATLRGR